MSDSLVPEARRLDLSDHLDEAVSALGGLGRQKKVDIPAAVALTSCLHQMYPSSKFTQRLREDLQPKLKLEKGDDKEAVTIFRVSLRFYSELVFAGVFRDTDLNAVGAALKLIFKNDVATKQWSLLDVVVSYLRHCGHDLAGFRSYSELALDAAAPATATAALAVVNADGVAETPPEFPVTEFIRTSFRSLILESLFQPLCADLEVVHLAVQKRARQNDRTMELRGELSSSTLEETERERQVRFIIFSFIYFLLILIRRLAL